MLCYKVRGAARSAARNMLCYKVRHAARSAAKMLCYKIRHAAWARLWKIHFAAENSCQSNYPGTHQEKSTIQIQQPEICKETTALSPGRSRVILGKYRHEKRAKRFTVFSRPGITLCVIFLQTRDPYFSFKIYLKKIG